jgi:hypothetical protein
MAITAVNLPCDLRHVERVKTVIAEELGRCWPHAAWGSDPGFRIERSRSQDGENLRIAIMWSTAPSCDDLITTLEALPDLPLEPPIKLSLRHGGETDDHHPRIYILRPAQVPAGVPDDLREAFLGVRAVIRYAKHMRMGLQDIILRTRLLAWETRGRRPDASEDETIAQVLERFWDEISAA